MKVQSNFNRNIKDSCIHAFQFYYDNKFDEAQAQVFANFMCEFIETKEE